MRVVLAFLVVLVLASSAIAADAFREVESSPGLGCGAMTNLTNTYFSWGDGVALPWIMTCIAWIESRWEPTAYNPSGATGLWQIMQPLWCNACDCSTLTTPDGNAVCANAILQSQGIGAWTPDPTTCENWLKYGGAPFSCEELAEPSPTLDWHSLDAKFFQKLSHGKPVKKM